MSFHEVTPPRSNVTVREEETADHRHRDVLDYASSSRSLGRARSGTVYGTALRNRSRIPRVSDQGFLGHSVETALCYALPTHPGGSGWPAGWSWRELRGWTMSASERVQDRVCRWVYYCGNITFRYIRPRCRGRRRYLVRVSYRYV
jgi:hypothetical protein